MNMFPWAVAAWLMAIGLYGMVSSRNVVHLVGCLSVVQSSTYVLLLSAGFRWHAGAPIFYTHPPGTPAVDPVVQALVLTDIVVGATLTALLLVLTIQAYKRGGSLDPEKLRPMRAGSKSGRGQGSSTIDDARQNAA